MSAPPNPYYWQLNALLCTRAIIYSALLLPTQKICFKALYFTFNSSMHSIWRYSLLLGSTLEQYMALKPLTFPLRTVRTIHSHPSKCKSPLLLAVIRRYFIGLVAVAHSAFEFMGNCDRVVTFPLLHSYAFRFCNEKS